MKILIDINHPAHVHYYRNFIKLMENRGHAIVVSNRDDDMINTLLGYYKIKHVIRNKRPKKKNYLLSMIYFIIIQYKNIILSFKEHPDFYIADSFVAFLFRKPSIELDDTEHNLISKILYLPFCSCVLTPYYFYKKLSNKQIFVHAFQEQLYLHKNYFKTDYSIYEDLGLKYNSKYAFIRFCSFDATHDHNVIPVSMECKKKMVNSLLKVMPVFISFEKEVDDPFFKAFSIKVNPIKIHSVIANANIFISEGATMACEAGLLGVPYIYINPLQNLGYILEQIKLMPRIAHSTINEKEIFSILDNLIKFDCPKNNVDSLFENKTIDYTSFLVWFVEKFPHSLKTVKENPDFQRNFF